MALPSGRDDLAPFLVKSSPSEACDSQSTQDIGVVGIDKCDHQLRVEGVGVEAFEDTSHSDLSSLLDGRMKLALVRILPFHNCHEIIGVLQHRHSLRFPDFGIYPLYIFSYPSSQVSWQRNTYIGTLDTRLPIEI